MPYIHAWCIETAYICRGLRRDPKERKRKKKKAFDPRQKNGGTKKKGGGFYQKEKSVWERERESESVTGMWSSMALYTWQRERERERESEELSRRVAHRYIDQTPMEIGLTSPTPNFTLSKKETRDSLLMYTINTTMLCAAYRGNLFFFSFFFSNSSWKNLSPFIYYTYIHTYIPSF